MSLRPMIPPSVPDETASVVRAAFPHGSLLLSLRDELGPVFEGKRFANLFPRFGRPAEAPWRLALITLLQFAERLSDRQAADAVRSRIDWKYVLALPLSDPGFDASVLCEFRTRLIAGAPSICSSTPCSRSPARRLPRKRWLYATEVGG